MFIKHRAAFAVSLLTTAKVSIAAPTARDGPAPALTPATITDWTTAALYDFLGAWNANNKAFNVKSPWGTVDFAGSNIGSSDQFQLNNLLFKTCDNQADGSNNTEPYSFSQKYYDFVANLTSAVPVPAYNEAVNDSNAKVVNDCYGGTSGTSPVASALTAALKAYNENAITTTNNASDPTFLSWANTNYPPYMQAFQQCQSDKTAYFNAINQEFGDDVGVYAAAAAHIQPLQFENEAAPGINMPVLGNQNQKGGTNGNYLPYYSIPTLNTTLTAWQAGNGLAQHTFDGQTYNFSSQQSSSFGGAHLGISFDGIGAEASASHSQWQSSAEARAFTFKLSFQGLALLEIEQGLWFDDYRVAQAAQNPDSKHQPDKAVFETYFGTQDKPGPLSRYNAMALVGYQPSWTIQYTNSSQSNHGSQTQFSFDLTIADLVNIGGYGGCSDNNTKIDNSTNTVTITDSTNNGYIIGFVQDSYWTWS